MTTVSVRVDGQVTGLFPRSEIALLLATDLHNTQPWPSCDARLARAEYELASGEWSPPDPSDPRVTGWREAYRAFGIKPNRMRPSIDALSRRVVRDGTIPRVNSAVDAYNLVSLRYGLPAGAFDLDAVNGEITIRRAGEEEWFTAIGGEPEPVSPGEVIYADEAGVLTRAWNYRDCERTKVTPDSTRVLFVVERVDDAVSAETLAAAASELAELVGEHAPVCLPGSVHATVPERMVPVEGRICRT